MPIELVAELATNHGGSVDLAAEMIRIAADSGAHTIKLQSYSLGTINPNDPQADWLRQAYLDEAAHETLALVAGERGVGFLATPFDVPSVHMLRRVGVTRFKIASSQCDAGWFIPDRPCIISYPWGRVVEPKWAIHDRTNVTAIPLYPTPLEAVEQATMLEGWSDHCVGITACLRALTMGVTYLEVHMAAPINRGVAEEVGVVTAKEPGRICPWDKNSAQIRRLRDAIDDFETIRSGVSRTFRERWLTA